MRLRTLTQFYTQLDRTTADRLLAPDFTMREAGLEPRYSRDDYLSLLYDTVLPSVPDFSCALGRAGGGGYEAVGLYVCGHSAPAGIAPGVHSFESCCATR